MDRIAAIKAGARFPLPSAETSTKVSDRGNYTGATLSLLAAPELFRDCVRRERTRGGGGNLC